MTAYNFLVVIPTYRDWDVLDKCVKSILRSNNEVAICVVNNAPEISCPFSYPPNVHIITEDAPGSYAARNRVIKMFESNWYLFTDSDCIVSSNWIENALKYCSDNKNEVVAGETRIFRGNASYFAFLYESVFAFQFEINKKSRSATTSNLLVSKAAFTKNGLFDQSLMSGGDVAWTSQYSSRGSRITFDSELFVLHPSRLNIAMISSKSKRVVGGFYDRSSSKLLFYLMQFRPPIIKISKVVKSKLGSYEKLVLSMIIFYLKFVELKEATFLILKLKKTNRT
jgi:GT2 family glycosyltransferase